VCFGPPSTEVTPSPGDTDKPAQPPKFTSGARQFRLSNVVTQQGKMLVQTQVKDMSI
jgi:hypothetical protein